MTAKPFNTQPILENRYLCLRPLAETDFDQLFATAKDPQTWAGHPVSDRFKPDVFRKYFDFLLETGSALIIIDRAENRVIGCSRYYIAPDLPDGISIRFTFLHHDNWGGQTNFQLKKLMLTHAFKTYDTVWFHIDPTNIRSQKATAKLGAKPVYDADLDLAGAPASWKCYSLAQSDWKASARKIEQES
ncbi:MAG: GNAT family N-acetyltransferase [Rhodobacteraceae bacterium]|nr:GNAT family N-acetyltransferase [Paracoccaceae bacterium]